MAKHAGKGGFTFWLDLVHELFGAYYSWRKKNEDYFEAKAEAEREAAKAAKEDDEPEEDDGRDRK